MFSDDFISYADDIIEAHQNKIVNSYKNYFKKNENFDEKNYQPSLFNEAMLYHWFTISKNPYDKINEIKNSLTLDQITFGYQTKYSKKTIQVNSDTNGIIYLPNYGYLETKTSSENIELSCDENGEIILKFGKNKIDFNFHQSYFLDGTNIEVCRFQLPYSNMFFDNINFDSKNFSIIVNQHLSIINHAFLKIKKLRPKYYEWFTKVITKIQVYDIPEVISFASMSMYSVPFVCTNISRSEVFYFEDIIHQAAHNIFYAITYYERANLFSHHPHSTISHFLNNDDQRTLYSSFHGLFTQANINLYFDICLDKSIFEGKLNHEVKGRLSDNMKRWEKSLMFFSEQDVLSDLGALLFNELVSVYEYLHEKWSTEIQKYDTTNQSYIFDYTKFEELNPYNHEK